MLKVRVALPDGSTLTREVEDHGDAAAVLAYDPERRVALMARQLRAPMLLAAGEPDVLEVVAGLLDGDEPEQCARREAEEEVGLRLGPLEKVVVLNTMPGISTERIHLFLAAYAASDRVGAGGGLAGESENITVEEHALADLAVMADDGRLPDAKTMLLIQTLRLRRPELFETRERVGSATQDA
ncbi:NUDIX domain-containing protein [uncultured Enterovirga sp.]|uniref:NUDIX domain-containing protein n=1 Tax=uncultured Enterovirga sp. TaxID=2026352 RepID=UPI0035C97576